MSLAAGFSANSGDGSPVNPRLFLPEKREIEQSNLNKEKELIDMIQLPSAVKDAISKQDIFPVATSSEDSIPNVVYIAYLKVIDDQTVLIADNYLNKTRENLLSNGKISFLVSDEKKGSFQIKGTAKRRTEGKMFDEVQTWVSDELPRVAAVIMHIEEVYNGAERVC